MPIKQTGGTERIAVLQSDPPPAGPYDGISEFDLPAKGQGLLVRLEEELLQPIANDVVVLQCALQQSVDRIKQQRDRSKDTLRSVHRRLSNDAAKMEAAFKKKWGDLQDSQSFCKQKSVKFTELMTQKYEETRTAFASRRRKLLPFSEFLPTPSANKPVPKSSKTDRQSVETAYQQIANSFGKANNKLLAARDAFFIRRGTFLIPLLSLILFYQIFLGLSAYLHLLPFAYRHLLTSGSATQILALIWLCAVFCLILYLRGVFIRSRTASVRRAVIASYSLADSHEAAFNVQQAQLDSARRAAMKDAEEKAAKERSVAEHGFDLENDECDRQLSEAQDKYATAIEATRQKYAAKLKEMHNAFADHWKAAGSAGADWRDRIWEDWWPDESPEFAARIGTLTVDTQELVGWFPKDNWKFTLPALVPFSSGRCLILKSTGSANNAAANALQSMVLRALANTPPGKMRFTLIDPVGLGQNVAGFMPLSDYDESLITSRAWTEPSHIEQRLTELTEHMENVIQKYLRADYKTIHEYNSVAHEVAEPFRYLVIFDFPVNFSDAAARKLLSIVRNGPRCGVYTMILSDAGKPDPYGFQRKELEQCASMICAENTNGSPTSAALGHRFKWESDNLGECGLELDEPPGNVRLLKSIELAITGEQAPKINTLFDKIIHISGHAAKASMKVEVPFEKMLSMAKLTGDAWESNTTAASLKVPLGRTGAAKLQYLELGGGTTVHSVVIGRPGSGKTNLMHVAIVTLALTYSPREVQLYLIDFKGGVGFKPYADHQLPHARVIAIESEREFGMSVLAALDAELKLRGEKFRAAGVDNLKGYREKMALQERTDRSKIMPRIFLMVDEFQEFFTEDDVVSQQSKQVIDRLVKQGRAFGIHLMLGTQSLMGSAMLPRATLDLITVRIVLQCAEADAQALLASDNHEARTLSRPGQALYNSDAGRLEGNHPLQVSLFTDEDLENQLRIVGKWATDKENFRSVPLVFEGNKSALLQECAPLAKLLEATQWTPATHEARTWLGEPVSIRDSVQACFGSRAGRHLLALANDEAMGVGVVTAAWLGLLAQHMPQTAEFYVLNLCTADAPWFGMAREIEELFPQHQIQLLDRRRLPEVMRECVDRINKVRQSDEASPARDPVVYLIILGLHRSRDLRIDESTMYSSDPEAANAPSRLLSTILRDGPEAGIHLLAWCDTFANARRSVDRSVGDFGLRVAGPMSAADSNAFLDQAVASRIDKPFRAVFSDEEKPGLLEKFRPYGLPDAVWLKAMAAKLKERR